MNNVNSLAILTTAAILTNSYRKKHARSVVLSIDGALLRRLSYLRHLIFFPGHLSLPVGGAS